MDWNWLENQLDTYCAQLIRQDVWKDKLSNIHCALREGISWKLNCADYYKNNRYENRVYRVYKGDTRMILCFERYGSKAPQQSLARPKGEPFEALIYEYNFGKDYEAKIIGTL